MLALPGGSAGVGSAYVSKPFAMAGFWHKLEL